MQAECRGGVVWVGVGWVRVGVRVREVGWGYLGFLDVGDEEEEMVVAFV